MDRPLVPSLGLFLADPDGARRGARRSPPVLHHSALRLLGRDHHGGHPLRLQRRRMERSDRQGRRRQPAPRRSDWRIRKICRPGGLPAPIALRARPGADGPTPRRRGRSRRAATTTPEARRCAARSCAAGRRMSSKRSADALLVDIGINDVGFAGWAASIILQDPALRAATGATAPCFDRTARCVAFDHAKPVCATGQAVRTSSDGSRSVHAAGFRHRAVACDRCRLSARAARRRGCFSVPEGNSGLTIATFPPPPLPIPFANSCRKRPRAARGDKGVLAEYPASDQVEEGCGVNARGETERKALAAFALRPTTGFDLVTAYTSDSRQARRLQRRPTGKAARRPGRRVSRRWIFSTCAVRPKLTTAPRSMHAPPWRGRSRTPVPAIRRRSCRFRRAVSSRTEAARDSSAP